MSGPGGRSLSSDERHVVCVELWFDRVAKDLSNVGIVDAAEAALDALWRRALKTLSDLTLLAIVERVVLHAADETPILALLGVEPSGLDTHPLREKARQIERSHLVRGLCGLLVELLAALDRTTAGVLTSALHETIANVSREHHSLERTESMRGKALRIKVRKKS